MVELPADTILRDDHPALRVVSQDVTMFDQGLQDLISNMVSAMQSHRGIGLAAPQLGVHQRVIVVNFAPYVLVNPVIVARARGIQRGTEGCLSSPGIWLDIARLSAVTVSYSTVRGPDVDLVQEKEFTGLHARVIQHEIDHLNGVLFTDYVSNMALMLARKRRK